MKWIAAFLMVITLLGYGKKDENKVSLILKGDIPARGEIRVSLYGYDRMLADHSATLIVLHRERLSEGEEVEIEVPEDAVMLIEPPVSSSENAAYYINIEIKNEEIRYTQDYDKNPFIEVDKGKKTEVFMKEAK